MMMNSKYTIAFTINHGYADVGTSSENDSFLYATIAQQVIPVKNELNRAKTAVFTFLNYVKYFASLWLYVKNRT